MLDNEATLISHAQRDPQAFGMLYDHYVERIYAYVQREVRDISVAQDIVSNTFEKALKNLPRYRWRGTSFGAWLYQIARNEIRMHYRRQNRLQFSFLNIRTEENAEQRVLQRDNQDHIVLALQQLSAMDQELLKLRYYEDLSNAEIATILNKSPGTIAVALHRALKRLRQKFENQEQEIKNYVRA